MESDNYLKMLLWERAGAGLQPFNLFFWFVTWGVARRLICGRAVGAEVTIEDSNELNRSDLTIKKRMRESGRLALAPFVPQGR